jgi:methionyl-tRNA formyltransferase
MLRIAFAGTPEFALPALRALAALAPPSWLGY